MIWYGALLIWIVLIAMSFILKSWREDAIYIGTVGFGGIVFGLVFSAMLPNLGTHNELVKTYKLDDGVFVHYEDYDETSRHMFLSDGREIQIPESNYVSRIYSSQNVVKQFCPTNNPWVAPYAMGGECNWIVYSEKKEVVK